MVWSFFFNGHLNLAVSRNIEIVGKTEKQVMDGILLVILICLLGGSYLLFNVRANKKQTNRKDRIKWRHK